MIIYRVDLISRSIRKREVAKITKHFVIFPPTKPYPKGRREALSSQYHCWKNTWEEAKQVLINNLSVKASSYRQVAERYDQYLKEAEALEEPQVIT